jgi:glycosyltransferase involved in cell wall biosynthesis
VTRRVALLLNNPFTADSRSWKLAGSLAAAGCGVTVIARAADGLPGREQRDGFTILRVAQPRPLPWLPVPGLPAGGASRPGAQLREGVGRAAQAVRYLLLTRAWAAAIAKQIDGAEVWQSEGLVTLPVALALRRELGGVVVYDSRDLHVESGRFARLPGPWRRMLARRERAWARSADALVTVNRPYARELERTLGRAATIVFNGPLAADAGDPTRPPPRLFHERFGLSATTRIALAVGAIVPNRGIEQACEAIGMVDDAVLVVVGDGEAKAQTTAWAQTLGHARRIRFLDAVPPDELPHLTAAADVAVMPIQPSTLNHRLTTPTRLFDALGAGLPVVASDLPGMAEIVLETGCGVLCDPTSPADIARATREVLDAPADRRAAWRAASLAAARGPYAWGRQVDTLLALYDSIAPREVRPGEGRPGAARP